MLKPTLDSLMALSLALTLACQPADEPPPTEGEETVPEDTTDLVPRDSLVETIGGNWIVRAPSGKACVSVPPSAIPAGDTLDVQIKLVTPAPPSFGGASTVFPPVYDFSVTDANGDPTQFADSVVFAICVNYGSGEKPPGVTLARTTPENTLDILPYADIPMACRLTCTSPSPPASATWLDDLFRGSPMTPAPAHAAVIQEGLGGKGRGTSPFAGVVP